MSAHAGLQQDAVVAQCGGDGMRSWPYGLGSHTGWQTGSWTSLADVLKSWWQLCDPNARALGCK